MSSDSELSSSLSSYDEESMQMMRYVAYDDAVAGSEYLIFAADGQMTMRVMEDNSLAVYAPLRNNDGGEGIIKIAALHEWIGFWFSASVDDDPLDAGFAVVRLNPWLYLCLNEHITPFQTGVSEELIAIYYFFDDTVDEIRALAATRNHVIALPELLRFPRNEFPDMPPNTDAEPTCDAHREFFAHNSDQCCYMFDFRAAEIEGWSRDLFQIEIDTTDGLPWTSAMFLRNSVKDQR